MVNYLITFFTHSGAMHQKKSLSKLGIEVELMPVPRKVSSDCGIAMRFESERDYKDFITDEVEAIYMVVNNQYVNAYRSNG